METNFFNLYKNWNNNCHPKCKSKSRRKHVGHNLMYPVLAFSLESHRQSSISLLVSFRFIDPQIRQLRQLTWDLTSDWRHLTSGLTWQLRSSGTHRIHNSLTEHVVRLSVVELWEPRNLCVCVIEECEVSEKWVSTGDPRDSSLCTMWYVLLRWPVILDGRPSSRCRWNTGLRTYLGITVKSNTDSWAFFVYYKR